MRTTLLMTAIRRPTPARSGASIARRWWPATGALLLAAAHISGCSQMKILPEPKRIEEVRSIAPVFKATNYTIQRSDLKDALANTDRNKFRLVPVYRASTGGRGHEHRIFDVREQSVFALLGLQTADIIVALDGFLVKRPDQLTGFVTLLAGQDQATIEIRRNGEARLFKYHFVPALGVKPPNALLEAAASDKEG